MILHSEPRLAISPVYFKAELSGGFLSVQPDKLASIALKNFLGHAYQGEFDFESSGQSRKSRAYGYNVCIRDSRYFTLIRWPSITYMFIYLVKKVVKRVDYPYNA